MPKLSEQRIRHLPNRTVQGALNQRPPRLLFGILSLRHQLPCSSARRIVGCSSSTRADERCREGCFPELQDSGENDLEASESTRPGNRSRRPPHGIASQN